MQLRVRPDSASVIAVLFLLAGCGGPPAPAVASQPAGGAEATEVAFVIDNATVVTMDGSGRVLSPASVAVDGTEIVAVDAPAAVAARYRGRQRLDLAGRLLGLSGRARVVHVDVEAVLRQREPARPADPGPAAGDHRDTISHRHTSVRPAV